MSYITAKEVAGYWREMTTEEYERAENLIPGVEDALRAEAKKRGKDLDVMLTNEEITESLLKVVLAGIIVRTLSVNTSGSSGVLSQESQSGLGYAWSGTYVSDGGGLIHILNNDLKRLGLVRQRYGVIDLYGADAEGGA